MKPKEDFQPPEWRQGKTGVWVFVMETPDGKVLATSEWGTNYEFAKAEWEGLPRI
jgi:hypothetical protein